MSLDALRDQLPSYAKDISLNLSSLAGESLLTDQQKWGCFLASAHAIGVAPVVKLIEAQAATVLSPEAMNAAKAAAAIMGMNNIYYRSLHLMKNHEYTT
ncbi:MAG: alkyl hydroperoxide reductase, partial [Brevundimonas sp.]